MTTATQTDEALTVTVEATGKPYDVTLTTSNGKKLDNVMAVRWECSIENPVPRASIDLDMAHAAFTVRPAVVLTGLDDLRFPLPEGLTKHQIHYLIEHIGVLTVDAYRAHRDRRTLYAALMDRGLGADEIDALLEAAD